MKFGYTIIYVEDVSATLEFFETAFGLIRKFLHESGDYGELSTGETGLAFASFGQAKSNFPDGVSRLTESKQIPGFEIALVTENVQAAVEQAVKAGAKLIVPPEAKPWGQTVAYVQTPDAILVEVCTAVASP